MIVFRVLCFCFIWYCALASAGTAFSQEVAITIDDLPSHGTLPPGLTRVDVANSILGTLRQAHAPKVYGFVNAKKLEQNPEEIEVLKVWRKSGFPLGNHTYAHLSLNDNSADQFDQNVAAASHLLGEQLRRLGEAGAIEGPSTRLLVHVGSLIADGISPRRACDVALVQALSDDADVQSAIRDVADAVFPA